MYPVRLAFVIVSIAAATGCSDTNPAGPSRPAESTVTDVVISGIDTIRTGASTTYTATVILSDGTTRTVAPIWASSDSSVARVEGVGRLDGLAHGSITLTASYNGRNASKTVQVVNDYAGVWDGRYAVRVCNASGLYRDVGSCQGAGSVGSLWSIRLTLSQNGGNQNEITGTLQFDAGIPGEKVTGVVTAGGRLNLRGTWNIMGWDSEDVFATMQVDAWETNFSGPGRMTGRWAQNEVLVGRYTGNLYQENELVTMTRVGQSAEPAP